MQVCHHLRKFSIDDEVNDLHIANVVINTEIYKFFSTVFCIDVIINVIFCLFLYATL